MKLSKLMIPVAIAALAAACTPNDSRVAQKGAGEYETFLKSSLGDMTRMLPRYAEVLRSDQRPKSH